MITMRQIAEEAGLSRYTVSKILNGDPSVKSASRETVLTLCERYGYLPDNNAVGLVKGKTNIIAMIVPYITDDFYNEILEMTERLAEAKGYRLIYKSSYNDGAREADIIKSFLALKVCALIIVPVVDDPDLRIHAIAAKQVPVIYFDRQLGKDGYVVLNNNEAGARTMTNHLLAKTRSVAFLDSFYSSMNPTAVARRAGYEKAMLAIGAEPVFIPSAASTERQDNEQYGYEIMTAFLKAGGKTKALFCITDAVALGACKAAQEAGLQPGKNIFIAGHDNLRFSAYVNPALTTMQQPKAQLSKACVELADKLIRGQRVSKKQYIFLSELIIRQSA